MGPETKKDSAGEGQQQFTALDWSSDEILDDVGAPSRSIGTEDREILHMGYPVHQKLQETGTQVVTHPSTDQAHCYFTVFSVSQAL
jgi:hypothetical protein